MLSFFCLSVSITIVVRYSMCSLEVLFIRFSCFLLVEIIVQEAPITAAILQGIQFVQQLLTNQLFCAGDCCLMQRLLLSIFSSRLLSLFIALLVTCCVPWIFVVALLVRCLQIFKLLLSFKVQLKHSDCVVVFSCGQLLESITVLRLLLDALVNMCLQIAQPLVHLLCYLIKLNVRTAIALTAF